MVIVDTSVLFDALVAGPDTASARTLFASAPAVTAPDLIYIEIAGALTRAVRRRWIEAAAAEQFFLEGRRLVPDTRPMRNLVERGLRLSLELAHPLGGCLYLALALAMEVPLMTSDRHFVRKVAGSPHEPSVLLLSSRS